jgi:MoxR-like ATPase
MNAPTSPTLVVERLRAALGAVIRGKPEAIDLLLTGLFANGHVLLEDVPGLGKTTLAKALARALRLQFVRAQFTPDLLPADILGAQVLHPESGSFSFQRGPIFTQVLLADEINRASPRTQSALLEAMSESQVTVDGVSHRLPEPFFVIATQNPVDFQGTYPLPEAQLDRFLLRFALGYPPPEVEMEVLESHRGRQPVDAVEACADEAALRAAQAEVQGVELKREVAKYLMRLVHATRQHAQIELGVSTRGALALYRAAQAHAFIAGRRYVTPDDLQRLAVPCLAHRVVLNPQARYGGTSSQALIAQIVQASEVPT